MSVILEQQIVLISTTRN